MSKHLLFVYGTLKKGYGNHRLLRESKFYGEAELPGFKIYDLGFCPGVTRSENVLEVVRGELYDISDDTLHRCDWLEGVDKVNPGLGMYRREECDVFTDKDEGSIRAFVYIYNSINPRHHKHLPDGVWPERNKDGA